MNKIRLCTLLPVLFLLSACAGNITFIPRAGGKPLKAKYDDSMGKTNIVVVLPNGEKLRGNLIWIPPGGGISTTLVNSAQGSAIASGVTSGNTGMYIGTIVGDQGKTMRIELLCNVWTANCVGVGKTNKGIIYDIQR